VVAFVVWYNYRHRLSGIKYATPNQRLEGRAVEICRRHAVVYEQARARNPQRWSQTIRCSRQPEVPWINTPSTELEPTLATLTQTTWKLQGRRPSWQSTQEKLLNGKMQNRDKGKKRSAQR
jgi:hypothetical protein